MSRQQADAAADLAGLPRPVSSEGARAHADFLDFGGHEKPANLIRALVSERDALAGRVAELEAERAKRKPSVVAPLKNAAYEGWLACRRELYALTSATTSAEITNDFERGRHFEAKGIARTFGAMQPQDDDELRATIGRIARAALSTTPESKP